MLDNLSDSVVLVLFQGYNRPRAFIASQGKTVVLWWVS